ncbi:MAG: aldo/keto reductase [Ruminococcaceae bacterium]|nr:aldo/keto reductase [Oscillospiraceae bacterium]
MNTVTLGRTGIVSGKNAFGALPIQRISQDEAVRLLRMAYDGGITFYDTARGYTDSEVKLGEAFHGMRDRIHIATKSHAKTPEALRKDLETSLRNLCTDYVDIYQFHNPGELFRPGDGTGMYEAMEDFRREGKIRFISLSNHRPAVAREAILSGLYDTLQFPFSYLATDVDLELVRLAMENNVGFIAMKGLSGGLLSNAAACYAFMLQHENVLPIWGIQREAELLQFLSYQKNPPEMDEEMAALIAKDRAELCGDFCRACGYCMPCPAGIEINTCARIIPLLGRAPYRPYLSKKWQENMEKINDCLHCGKCMAHCPYGLNTPELLRTNYEFYQKFLAEHLDEAEK